MFHFKALFLLFCYCCCYKYVTNNCCGLVVFEKQLTELLKINFQNNNSILLNNICHISYPSFYSSWCWAIIKDIQRFVNFNLFIHSVIVKVKSGVFSCDALIKIHQNLYFTSLGKQ